jgi:hypothetical protein
MLASQIITNICLSAGINPGKVDLGKDIMFDTYVANGYFRAVLDRLCALTGSINSFKNGVLYITPKSINGSIPVTVQYLTPQSGLVGIPEPTMVNGKAALKFQTLFFFSLQSGDKVELYSAEYHTNLKLVNGKKKFATFADIAESEWEAEII